MHGRVKHFKPLSSLPLPLVHVYFPISLLVETEVLCISTCQPSHSGTSKLQGQRLCQSARKPVSHQSVVHRPLVNSVNNQQCITDLYSTVQQVLTTVQYGPIYFRDLVIYNNGVIGLVCLGGGVSCTDETRQSKMVSRHFGARNHSAMFDSWAIGCLVRYSSASLQASARSIGVS